MNNTFLLVGLGNLGKSYNKNRHNLGFLFVDFFVQKNNLTWKEKPLYFFSEININNKKLLILKSKGFMNNSGKMTKFISNYFKIDSKRIIIAYDDADMEFSKIKVKNSGSSGGHNGIKDIISELKTNNFIKLKCGIGKHTHIPLEKHVLEDFSKSELNSLNESIFCKMELIIRKLINEDNF